MAGCSKDGHEASVSMQGRVYCPPTWREPLRSSATLVRCGGSTDSKGGKVS